MKFQARCQGGWGGGGGEEGRGGGEQVEQGRGGEEKPRGGKKEWAWGEFWISNDILERFISVFFFFMMIKFFTIRSELLGSLEEKREHWKLEVTMVRLPS